MQYSDTSCFPPAKPSNQLKISHIYHLMPPPVQHAPGSLASLGCRLEFKRNFYQLEQCGESTPCMSDGKAAWRNTLFCFQAQNHSGCTPQAERCEDRRVNKADALLHEGVSVTRAREFVFLHNER